MSALGSLVVKLALEYAEYTQGLDKSEQAALKFAQNAQRGFDQAAGATKEFFGGVVSGALAGVAAYVSVSAAIDKITHSIDTLAKLDDLNQKTGASVENASKLQKVAVAFNQEMGAVESGLVKLSKGMSSVDSETNKTQKALSAIGVSAKDAAGNLRDPAEVMVDVAKKLQGYQDTTAKTALMNDLLGKSGADLLPYFNDLAENFDKFTGASAEAATAAADMQDRLGLMKVHSQELYTALAIALVPAMADFVDMLLDASKGTNTLSGAAKGLAGDGSLTSWAKTGTEALAFIMDAAQGVVVAFKSVGMALGATMAMAQATGESFTGLGKIMMGQFSSGYADIKAAAAAQQNIWSNLKSDLDGLWNDGAANQFSAKLAAVNDRRVKQQQDYAAQSLLVLKAYAGQSVEVQQAAMVELAKNSGLSFSGKNAAMNNDKQKLAYESGHEKKESTSKYDAAIKKSEDFIAQIEKETAHIGATTEQKKGFDAEQIASTMRLAGVQEMTVAKFITNSAAAATALEKRKDAFKDLLDLQKIHAGMVNDQVAALDREALADYNMAVMAKEYAASVQASNDYLALETSLLGASDVQRQIALANKRIDLDLDRQILDIKRQLGSAEAQNAAIEAATQAARSAKTANATSIVANDNYAYVQKAAEDARNAWAKTGADIQRTLGSAFGKSGEAIGKMANLYGAFMTSQLAAEKKLADAKRDANGDPIKIIKAETEAREESTKNQIGMYGDMAGAAKGFFDEQSTAYRVLEGIEKAMFAWKFAMQMKDLYTSLFVSSAKASGVVAGQTVETGAVVAGEAARNVAKVPGVFMSFMSALGPWGAAAAAIAVAAVLGSAMGGGGGGTSFMSAKERQAKQGAGSVFGGAEDDKSSSLSKSLELLRANSDIALPLTSRMLFVLNSIDGNIGGLVNAIVRTTGLRGGPQDTLGMGLGSSKGAFGFSSESKELVDQGIAVGVYGTVKVPHTRQVRNYTGAEGGEGESTEETYYTEETKFKPQTIGQVRAAGSVDGSKYSMTHSEESSWWGLSQSSSDDTIYKELDKSIKRQMGLTVISIAEGVEEGAVALGASREEVRKEIDAYNVEIGLISLKGLSGQELQDELNAVFSKFGDGLAASVMPGLDDFEKVGEGYLQTLVRVASGVESAQYSLEKLGITAIDYTAITNKQGDVATEILRESIAGYETVGGKLSGIGDIIDTFTGTADELIATYGQLTDTRNMLDDVGAKSTDVTREMIRAAGGLDKLQAGIKSYYDAYFSEDEKRANSLQRLGAEFSKLQDPVTGLALTMPTSMAGFRAMAEGIDTSTAAGQALYAKVMLLADGFGDVQGAIEAERAERMKSFDSNFMTDKEQENKAKATALQDLDATFATLGQAVPQTHQQFVDLFNSFNDANDPMHKTRDALLKVSDSFVTVHGSAQDAADAIDSIKELISGVHDAAQNSIFNMKYDVADNEGKYKLLDAKGAGYEKEMRGTDDINQIADFAQKQIAVLDQAWGLLDEDQKRALQAQFEAKYNDIDQYVKEKGADAIGLQKANNAELAGMIGKEVAAALFGTGVAGALEAAAAGIASAAEVDPNQEAAVLVAKGGGSFEQWKETAAGGALVDPAEGMLGMGGAIGNELAQSFQSAMQAMISGPQAQVDPRIEVDPAAGKNGGMSGSESKAYAAKVAESAESNKASAESLAKTAAVLAAAAESLRLAAATPIKSELSVNVTAVAGVEVAIA